MTYSPDIIKRLVETVSDNFDSHRSSSYKEAQIRREFIHPMFEALGWNVDNERSWAEAYKEIIHEDAIRIDGFPKAPDYCFRIGGTRKFFLEAKKPAVRVRSDPVAVYQLRGYACRAKLISSILRDPAMP